MSCGEAGEVVPEHGGAAVVPLDRRVISNAVERRIDGPRRQAVLDRDLLEGGEPGAEALAVSAAILGVSGRSGKNRRSCDENQCSQFLPQSRVLHHEVRGASDALHPGNMHDFDDFDPASIPFFVSEASLETFLVLPGGALQTRRFLRAFLRPDNEAPARIAT